MYLWEHEMGVYYPGFDDDDHAREDDAREEIVMVRSCLALYCGEWGIQLWMSLKTYNYRGCNVSGFVRAGEARLGTGTVIVDTRPGSADNCSLELQGRDGTVVIGYGCGSAGTTVFSCDCEGLRG